MKFFIELQILRMLTILQTQNCINTREEFNLSTFQKRYDEYKVKHVYEFNSTNYNYYLTTQLSSTEQGSLYTSKIIRICNNNSGDISGHGYIEIPIMCGSTVDTPYDLVQAAHVGKPGLILQKFLKIEPNDDVLFVVFSKSEKKLSSNNPKNASALCMYSLKQIDEKFTENIRNCFDGNGNRGFGSMLMNQLSQKVNQNIFLDFCNSTPNMLLEGNKTLNNAPFYSEESLFTAIITTSSEYHNDVFIGTSTGKIIKIIQNMWGHPMCKDMELTVRDSRPVTSFFQNREYLHVYVIPGNDSNITGYNVSISSSKKCADYTNVIECNNTKGCDWFPSITFSNQCITNCDALLLDPKFHYVHDFHDVEIIDSSSNEFQIGSVETLQLKIFLREASTFNCTYIFENTTLRTKLIIQRTYTWERKYNANCSTPEADGIPKIPKGMTYLKAKFSIQTDLQIDIVTMDIIFFDCKLHTSFNSCDSSTFSCQWNNREKNCTHVRKKMPSNRNGTCPDSSLPSILTISPQIRPRQGESNTTIQENNSVKISSLTISPPIMPGKGGTNTTIQGNNSGKTSSGRNNTCPDSSPPSISSIQPLIGPWEGGTNITIQGNNLGCKFEDIGQNIKVAGEACKPYKETYKTSELITCLINKPRSLEHSEGPVELYINGTSIRSTQYFKFVNFIITDIDPKEAYTYGGAELTIKGENLNAGRSIEVYIGNTLCTVFLRNLSTIQCISNPSSADKENKVVVKIDKSNHTLPNNSFKYVKDKNHDDEGFNIVPKGIPAGGVQMLILDEDSQSIQKLSLRIHDGNQIYNSSCEIRNDSTSSTTWICLSPNISYYDSNSIDVKKPREMNISFANSTNDEIFFKNQPRKFLLYPNPVFDSFFNSFVEFGQNSFVIIQGRNIDKACQKSDIKVNVGSHNCDVISISSRKVICSLPTRPSPDSEKDSEQTYDILAEHDNITVSIGPHFNVTVSRPHKIQHTALSENSMRYIIYVFIISVAVILSIIVFHIIKRKKIIMKYSRRVRKLEREANVMRMETINVRQCIKRVIIKNAIPLDENSSQILKLPTVEIEDTLLPRNSTGTSAESGYILPLDDIWEFPKSNLTLGECLGEGEFGRVVQGQAKNILGENTTTIVAVKMLKDNHSDEDMICLVSEMEIMKLIGMHVNVLRLLGCCTQDGALFVITEYAQYGNLRDFLRRHLSPDGEMTAISLSQESLIMFAVQVAKGMEYLASIKCIHRDLAARNILVADDYTAKIADFGLSRDITNKEYYKKTTQDRMPVKWMAPESLCHNIYSTQSDVWSYGILLWEIFTLGGVPYPSLMNQANLYQILRSGYRMEKPPNCSVKIYSLMCKCWNFHPTERPLFSTIVQKLQDEHTVNAKNNLQTISFLK